MGLGWAGVWVGGRRGPGAVTEGRVAHQKVSVSCCRLRGLCDATGVCGGGGLPFGCVCARVCVVERGV